MPPRKRLVKPRVDHVHRHRIKTAQNKDTAQFFRSQKAFGRNEAVQNALKSVVILRKRSFVPVRSKGKILNGGFRLDVASTPKCATPQVPFLNHAPHRTTSNPIPRPPSPPPQSHLPPGQPIPPASPETLDSPTQGECKRLSSKIGRASHRYMLT